MSERLVEMRAQLVLAIVRATFMAGLFVAMSARWSFETGESIPMISARVSTGPWRVETKARRVSATKGTIRTKESAGSVGDVTEAYATSRLVPRLTAINRANVYRSFLQRTDALCRNLRR